MHAELPRVAIGLNRFRLSCHRFIRGLLWRSVTDARLEVRVVVDAVWRIYVDHLNLAAEPLFLQKTCHDNQRIAQDHPINPVHSMPVELDSLSAIEILVAK